MGVLELSFPLAQINIPTPFTQYSVDSQNMAQGTAREYGGAPRHFSTPGCKEEEVLLLPNTSQGASGHSI